MIAGRLSAAALDLRSTGRLAGAARPGLTAAHYAQTNRSRPVGLAPDVLAGRRNPMLSPPPNACRVPEHGMHSDLRSCGWLVLVQEAAKDGSAGDLLGWSSWDRVVRSWWS
jgi:hypothetical protein